MSHPWTPPQPPEPPNRNRDARLYMLGMWVLSLSIGAFLPYLGLQGFQAALVGLLILAATTITSSLVVFTFQRYWVRLTPFILGVVLAALTWTALNAFSSIPQSLPIQSITSVIALITANLLWMTALIGLGLIWQGKGGWPLLAIGSVVALWTPLVFARIYSVDGFISAILGITGQASPVSVVFCGALCAIPIGGLAVLTRLMRGLWRELGATKPSKSK